MERSSEDDNNNKPFVRRGLGDEDEGFSSMRSSLRARRDRLAKREQMLQTNDTSIKSTSSSPVPTALLATESPPSVISTPPQNISETISSARQARRARIAEITNEYSQPNVDTQNDVTAKSLISSSKILSMDDLSPVRGTTVRTLAGENGVMSGLRRSLPGRSRRVRREVIIDDLGGRTRAMSRELVNESPSFTGDVDSILQREKELNGSIGRPSSLAPSPAPDTSDETVTPTTTPRGDPAMPRNDTEPIKQTGESPRLRESYGDPIAERRRDSLQRRHSSIDGGRVQNPESSAATITAADSTSSIAMSSGGLVGETREERIARYKEMRRKALAERQAALTPANDGSEGGSGFKSRYPVRHTTSDPPLNHDSSNRGDEVHIPRWRRNRDPDDMLSSSNASSITDLHINRKDSSASSDNSSESAAGNKLTMENLKLHDRLSATSAPPYSSLSRLEETTVTGGVADNEGTPTNKIPPVSLPERGDKTGHSKVAEKLSEKRASASTETQEAKTPTKESYLEKTNRLLYDFGDTKPVSTRKTSNSQADPTDSGELSAALSDKRENFSTKSAVPSAEPTSTESKESHKNPSRVPSNALSARLKMFQPESSSTSNSNNNAPVGPGKLNLSKFTSARSPTSPTGPFRVFTPANKVEGLVRRFGMTPDCSVRHSVTVTPMLSRRGSMESSVSLDPQLAAKLAARKQRNGEAAEATTDIGSALRSKLKSRVTANPDVSVSARASFFVAEAEASKRINKSTNSTPTARPASLLKKKTRPVKRLVKAKSTSDIRKVLECRGRRFSVPQLKWEFDEIKKGSPPQKIIRPKEPKPVAKRRPTKKTSNTTPVSARLRNKNVTAKVDSRRTSTSKSPTEPSTNKSIPTKKPSITDSSLKRQSAVDRPVSSRISGAPAVSNSSAGFRRTASMRVSNSSLNSEKSASTSNSGLDRGSRVGSIRRSGVVPKVFSGANSSSNRKLSTDREPTVTKTNGEVKPRLTREPVHRTIRDTSVSKSVSRRSGAGATPPQLDAGSKSDKLTIAVTSADSIDGSLLSPTSSSVGSKTTRSRRLSSGTAGSEDTPRYMKSTQSAAKRERHSTVNEPSQDELHSQKRRSTSLRIILLDSGMTPGYMRPTNSFAHRLEAQLTVDQSEEPDEIHRKHYTAAPIESGHEPSFMKPTASSIKREEKEEEPIEERRPKRVLSPTLPDGDLPSYMKATEAYFKKVEHLFAEPEEEEEKPKSVAPIVISNGELPSFMKPTKSFEAALKSEDEHVEPHKPKTVAPLETSQGLPRFLRPTQATENREKPEPEHEPLTPTREPPRKISGQFMKATKATEQRVAREKEAEDKRETTSVRRTSLQNGHKDDRRKSVDKPSKMKKSESTDREKKSSVGSFLRKKLGLSKDQKEPPTRKLSTSKASDDGSTPSYMRATSNSSQRKVADSPDETNQPTSMNSSETARSNMLKTEVSVDGVDHIVNLRNKKNTDSKPAVESPSKPKSTLAHRSASVRVKGAKAQELLQSLQSNGEEGWKSRIGNKDFRSFRSGTIHDRLSKIDDDSKKWQRNKGAENDSKQFTVEGKLQKKGVDKVMAPSPLMPRKERTPGGQAKRAGSLRLKRESGTPVNAASKLALGKSTSNTPARRPVTDIFKTATSPNSPPSNGTGNGETEGLNKVSIPTMDDASEFFTNSSAKEEIQLSSEDFDHLFVYSEAMLPSVVKPKPARKQPARSANPVKSLQNRANLVTEYTETKTDVAEKELRRVNKEKIAQNAQAQALAGLASKEDIAKVSLKKVDGSIRNTGGVAAAPFNDLMLIHIKGRRHVEMRLVEPTSKSINSGDCFLLVTPAHIYQWNGEFANVMERSKATDLATYIHRKRDLGYKATRAVTVIDEARQVGGAGNEFWKLLGGNPSYSASGPVEEDELYENYMAETNVIYEVVGEDLEPIEELCAQIPKYSMLQEDKMYIFDFGTEVYVWCGKAVPMSERRKGMKLARTVFEQGYDYSECDINPMSPLCLPDKGGLPNQSKSRPDWCICGKVTSKMETLLFKEKFFDWPESSRLIQVKDVNGDETTPTTVEELKAFDVEKMLEKPDKPVTLVLEQSNVGRGRNWVEYEDGLRREYEIVTNQVRMWHVSASDYYELMEDSYGQLHSGDTYVVRWQYTLRQSGMRDLKGEISKRQSIMGRERCAYFFWQGANSSINEKGASALMTVELDEEHGPQVRVEQGQEPACFLSIFNGRMISHLGKRDDNNTAQYKLYVVLHQDQHEISLQEVPVKIENLRSRGVLILINLKTGHLHIWKGCKSSSTCIDNAKRIAFWLSDTCPMEVGVDLEVNISIHEEVEGSESRDFMMAIRSNNRSRYNSLLNSPSTDLQSYEARLFHMTSVNLVFHVQEVFSLHRNTGYTCFPFSQSQLYKADQPTLFLLDFGDEIILWQGWWPQASEDVQNVHTGSAEARFSEDRKLSLETALNYKKARGLRCISTVVYAGREPVSFTSRFASWENHEEAIRSNALAGKPTVAEDMEEIYNKLSKTVYTWEELQERPLPDGVNPNKIESYLSDSDFLKYVKMARAEFDALPAWKKTNVRKDAGLF